MMLDFTGWLEIAEDPPPGAGVQPGADLGTP